MIYRIVLQSYIILAKQPNFDPVFTRAVFNISLNREGSDSTREYLEVACYEKQTKSSPLEEEGVVCFDSTLEACTWIVNEYGRLYNINVDEVPIPPYPVNYLINTDDPVDIIVYFRYQRDRLQALKAELFT